VIECFSKQGRHASEDFRISEDLFPADFDQKPQSPPTANANAGRRGCFEAGTATASSDRFDMRIEGRLGLIPVRPVERELKHHEWRAPDAWDLWI
jgi:hypothetical protein